MRKFSTAIKTLVLLAASIGSVQAATVDLGNLYGNSVVIGQSHAGKNVTFSDDYLFSISPSASFAAAVTSINLQPYFSAGDMKITLSGTGLASAITKSATAGDNLDIAPVVLGYGDYVFNVSGMTTGDFGASYAGVLAAAAPVMNNVGGSPVPVPAAAWLLGSGLLGLVGVARRKTA